MVTQIEQRKVRLSITIAPELKALVEKIADESNTSMSGFISCCLEEITRKHQEESLIKYYKDMSTEHKEVAQKSAKVIQKIASSWAD